MNYDNAPCPACGKPLAEGEDIVVCPVCATPQHRECWMQNGRCANDDLHDSGYVWKKENTVEPPMEEHDTEENGDCRVCHICGSENPADALHCGNCGALLNEVAEEQNPKKCAFCGKENSDDALHCNQCGAPLGTKVYGGAYGETPNVAGTDITADEKIGENIAGDLAIYVQASPHRYLPKFKKFESGKKFSFNFAAFFFTPYWFFYRKLYKAGTFFLVAFVTLSILLSGYSNAIYDASEEYTNAFNGLNLENATEEELVSAEKEMEKLTAAFYKKVKKPAAILFGATVIFRLVCALAADKLYYKKILEDMNLISETVQDIHMRRMMLARKGGLAPLAFGASLIGETLLINLLYYAADFIKNIF